MKPSSRLPTSLVFLAVAAACARHSGDIAGVGPGKAPVFETRIEIPTGTSVHADYRVADFNRDGLLDMAVISLTGELRILLGNGSSFPIDPPAEALQLDGIPSWMTGGDFNGDGFEDLVVVRSAANSTELLLNDGLGSFAVATSLPVGLDALAVTVGDWNGDNKLDVAVSRPLAPEIFVAYGDGSGGFPTLQQIGLPGTGQAFNLASGDFTRDGRADLLIADPVGSRVLILTGVATDVLAPDFLVLDVPGAPGAIALGDLSGDGLDDMAVAAFDANQYVVITDLISEGKYGGGTQNVGYQSFDIPVPERPSVATIADVTGDGRVDLCACLAFHASMAIAVQLPGGGFTGIDAQILLDSSGFPLRPFVADFDRNGKADLFALSGGGTRVNLWLGKPDSGELAGARGFLTGLPTAAWLEGADFDLDGDFEVVSGSPDDSRLSFLAKGAAGLVRELTLDVGLPVYQLRAGDLDGDGKMDLVIGVPGGIRLLHNRSTVGTYDFEVLPGSPATLASGNLPFGIALADFDRDADIDIAVCDYAGGGMHIVPGTATPFVFGTESVIDIGGGPVDVVAADFTGDGLKDLAVSRANAANILVLRNAGTSFVPFRTVPVGEAPNYLITADFNLDGRSDLVVSNAVSGTVSVLFGTADGFDGKPFAAGAMPTALLANDLSGDGLPDILVASLQSGDFRILVGDGRGSFPILPTFPGTFGASDAVLHDMDGDGRTDLMISSLVTNRVSLVRNITP